MAVQVTDLDTGVMGLGAIYDTATGTMPPLTYSAVPGFEDAPFEGMAIPYFTAGIQYVRHAHAIIAPAAEYIGWDFCVTSTGPQLIECNTLCSTSYFGDALPRLTHARLADNMLERFKHIDYGCF